MKKRLKSLEVTSQSDLINLMIAVVARRIDVDDIQVKNHILKTVEGLNLTYKRIDPAVIDYLSDFDLSLFVTEADGFLEDLKRNTTGSFYTPIEWVRYMTKISVSDWIVETLKTHKVKAPAQPTQWVLALAKKYDEGEWQSGMEVFKSLSMSEEELTILLNAFENIRVIDIACGGWRFFYLNLLNFSRQYPQI